MPNPDFRALCAQALQSLEYHTQQTRPITQTSITMDMLRALLAQPAPKPPTDEELQNLWDAQDFKPPGVVTKFARAVLARWGQGNG